MQKHLGLMLLAMACGVLSLLGGTAFPTPLEEACQRDLYDYYIRDGGLVLPTLPHFERSLQTPSQLDLRSLQTPCYSGLHAYYRQNYATALQEWWPIAQQGAATAQVWVGIMYEKGEGVAQDNVEAVKWYRKAADQGHALAQYHLGLMYEWGKGVAKDLAEAQRWFAQAAEASLGTDWENFFGPSRYNTTRDEAIKAHDRVASKLATASTPAPAPVSSSPSPPASMPTIQTQSRRALVIGNAAYPDSPLTNPVNDATDLATLLRRLDFNVMLHRNADKPTMEKAVDLFTHGVPRGSAGLFFFAGHGVQIDGINYLVPIGAPRFNAASDVHYHAVAADWVLARMEESGMDVKLLLLDACRDNPLGRSFKRAFSRGLGVMDTPKGALISYATSPGKTASDGPGRRNSPFTVQLLRELVIAGRDIEVALKAVRAGVQQSTKGEQIPWVASSMTGDFSLAR